MAGHFIGKGFTTSDFAARAKLGITLSPVQHQGGAPIPHGGGNNYLGWNPVSKVELTTALSGGHIANRERLPPHYYFMIGASNPVSHDLKLFLASAGWVDKLERPGGAGLGLRNLCAAADARWNAGDKDGALSEQIKHGNVSIEIYYIAGYEVN